MKKIILFYSVVLCLSGCNNENDNKYFASDNIYNTVIKSVDNIHSHISKTDKIFYVFNRQDTLIIMSSENEDILRPTYSIDKIGYFNYKKNKIIITKPYKPKFELIKKKNELIHIDNNSKPPYYDGKDYQKGIVYKIVDLNHLDLVYQGNLMKYFKPMAEYEYSAPPPPAK